VERSLTLGKVKREAASWRTALTVLTEQKPLWVHPG